jgi:hypothetical protein
MPKKFLKATMPVFAISSRRVASRGIEHHQQPLHHHGADALSQSGAAASVFFTPLPAS